MSPADPFLPTYGVNAAGNGIFIAHPPLGPISYATFYRLDLFMTISHSPNLTLTPCDTRTRCDLPILNAFATGKINCVVVIVAVPALPPLFSLVFFFFYICLCPLFLLSLSLGPSLLIFGCWKSRWHRPMIYLNR